MRSQSNGTSLWMKAARTTWCKLAVAVCGFAVVLPATAQTIVTFDIPGSIRTEPHAINNSGVITGLYVDATHHGHGCVRAADGTLITIDIPGEGPGNQPWSINPSGTPRAIWK